MNKTWDVTMPHEAELRSLLVSNLLSPFFMWTCKKKKLRCDHHKKVIAQDTLLQYFMLCCPIRSSGVTNHMLCSFAI
jgi:hypothetical protein